MKTEFVRIFDENERPIGVKTRAEVHEKGYWHEAFHCWFVEIMNEQIYIHFQLRSAQKKDYPNLFDITAAGHLLADETVADGVREVKEEIGIEVTLEELISLGTLKYCVTRGALIDKELAHTFLGVNKCSIDQYVLQREEVAGMARVRLEDAEGLWSGTYTSIHIAGYVEDSSGFRRSLAKQVGTEAFVPHDSAFYQEIFIKIRKHLHRFIGQKL
ncbi:NUDIX domain-containing protein [Priestia koreensis]|uniref:NUDIX hydrolase n=1 Tax=Priestia koreensis TaxID=284581 RepID=UPI0028F6D03E|nr:NUDIX domain-containing protein [Priestia koreensis]